MNDKFIKVWRWQDAPKKYKELSDNGGDEDWVVFVPDKIANSSYIHWLYHIDTCMEPQEIKVSNGYVYIGAHS